MAPKMDAEEQERLIVDMESIAENFGFAVELLSPNSEASNQVTLAAHKLDVCLGWVKDRITQDIQTFRSRLASRARFQC